MAYLADMFSAHIEPRWPPRSPHEALLSSPTGRQKVRQYHDRTSPSPSPLRKSSALKTAQFLKLNRADQAGVGSDEDEDEETLQLQLAAIEAKLKLKKLREKKDGTPSDSKRGASRGFIADGKENSRSLAEGLDHTGGQPLPRPKTSREVQIPVSPQRKPIIAEEAKSPGRILLGIDKGLKGRNVSLRKPAGENSKDDDPFRTRLPPNRDLGALASSSISSTAGPSQSNRPMSFSEKIAETRRQDKALKERADNARKQRSTGFGIQQQEIDAFSRVADTKSTNSRQRSGTGSKGGVSEFSREEILEAAKRTSGGQVRRSNTSASIRRIRADPSTDIWINPNAPPEAPTPPASTVEEAKKRSRSLSPARKTTGLPSQEGSAEAPDSDFESFSSLHLSRRLLPHDFLTRTFSEKHVFILPDLLGTVKSPDYMLPDIPEADYVVLAIIASKSAPLNHKGIHRSAGAESTSMNEAAESEQNTNGKYMVLTLTNLKWTVDLFLFATGYTRFRKLVPGTVVALLNPDLMPPPPGKADTGRFSLKLSSSDDTVLEIGTSRDLGWCKSVRKDGKQCETWIDKRHTEYCEFHVDVVVERTRRGRMEVQGMSAPFAPGGKGRKGGRTGYFGERKRDYRPTKCDHTTQEGPKYDRSSSSRYFVAPSIPGQSAAQLLDAEGATDRYGSREDRVRKRLAEREKENDIARRLGEGGNGAGSEYLRLKHGLGPSTNLAADPEAADPVDATSLGLLGNKARNVHLSPIKKRKGGVLEAERSVKKTRFVTDRGIKEAGRESFGGEVAGIDDDDDGLEVI